MTCPLANPIKLTLVTTLVALFLATAWAGNTARADEDDDDFVGTNNLLDGAVTEPKIADSAVTTSKVGSAAVTNGKIADGAVTSGKIAAGAVGADQIGDGAVGSGKLADGAVTEPKIGPAAVTNGKIADGAVTSGKLATGAVGAGQIGNGAVGSDALAEGAVTTGKLAAGAVTLDKLDPSIELGGGTELLRTIVVSPVGPTVADNCNELLAALDSIPFDNTAENAHLIKLEPGIYDCGTDLVDIKPYVNVEGAGANITRIISSAAPGVSVAAHSGLRLVSISYAGVQDFAAAISAQAPSRISDIDVTIESAGSFATTAAIFVSVSSGANQFVLKDIVISAGISNVLGVVAQSDGIPGGLLFAENLLINTDRAFGVSDGVRATIRNSVLLGGVDAGNTGGTGIIATQVTGQVFGSAARCVGSYNAQFEPLDGSCGPTP